MTACDGCVTCARCMDSVFLQTVYICVVYGKECVCVCEGSPHQVGWRQNQLRIYSARCKTKVWGLSFQMTGDFKRATAEHQTKLRLSECEPRETPSVKYP